MKRSTSFRWLSKRAWEKFQTWNLRDRLLFARGVKIESWHVYKLEASWFLQLSKSQSAFPLAGSEADSGAISTPFIFHRTKQNQRNRQSHSGTVFLASVTRVLRGKLSSPSYNNATNNNNKRSTCSLIPPLGIVIVFSLVSVFVFMLLVLAVPVLSSLLLFQPETRASDIKMKEEPSLFHSYYSNILAKHQWSNSFKSTHKN